MFDNLTLEKVCKPPNALLKANGRPFEHLGVWYWPVSENGKFRRYDAQINNLRLYRYLDKVFLCNSLHKYWHGNNYGDFYLSEMPQAVESLCETTGVNWYGATVKKLEYGCNIPANAAAIYRSLKRYKTKDYLPMKHRGNVYGMDVGFNEYQIKGYDKTYQVKQKDGLPLRRPLFRWEVVVKQMRHLESKLQISPILLNDLLQPETWQALANDAIMKYETSIKMQILHLHKLSPHQKRIIAEMLVPEIREDFRLHNKETYKRDRRIFKQIMTDKSICEVDGISKALQAKFEQLMTDNSTSRQIPLSNL